MPRRHSRAVVPSAVCLAIAAGGQLSGCGPTVGAREFAITPPLLLVGPPSTDTLHARGGNPDWRLDITDTVLNLRVAARDYRFMSPRPSTLTSGSNYLTASGGSTLGFRFETATCALAGETVVYPRRFNLQLDGRLMQGCGGDPGDLLRGAPWRITAIDGQALPPLEAPVILRFGPTGKLSVRLPCGALSGQYLLSSGGLRISRVAAAPSPCLSAAQRLDTRLQEQLLSVEGFSLPAPLQLRLEAGGANTLDAVRMAQ